jgi:hypothetical protein
MDEKWIYMDVIHDNIKEDDRCHGHKNYQNNMNSKENEPTMTKVGLILILNTKCKNQGQKYEMCKA